MDPHIRWIKATNDPNRTLRNKWLTVGIGHHAERHGNDWTAHMEIGTPMPGSMKIPIAPKATEVVKLS